MDWLKQYGNRNIMTSIIKRQNLGKLMILHLNEEFSELILFH